MNAPNKNNKQVQKLNENKLMFRVISVMQKLRQAQEGFDEDGMHDYGARNTSQN